jgi:hypothetical protein
MMGNKETIDKDWADKELKRLATDLASKRAKAIEYLGDKWILKGGKYDRVNNVVLRGEK